MGFLIEVDRELALVTLSVEGPFDLSHGFALHQYCQPERPEVRFRHYVINLARATDLRDAGLGWLRMFTRWAGERGIGVQVINARPEHTARCRQWDIAVYRPGPPRLGPEPEVPLPERFHRVEA